MFDCQIHEREAYRALFAFGGTLVGLDTAQVSNVSAAVINAKKFTAEVLERLKASAKSTLRAEEMA
jgi:chromosome partitioning protein